MSSTSYLSKVFTVDDPDARIRRDDELLQFVVYKAGDVLPAGRRIGDPKIIPTETRVKVTEIKIANDRVFGRTQASDNPAVVFGWTSTRNFRGKFTGETLGELPPMDNNPKGRNAAWEKGQFIGQKTLVIIVDNKMTVEQITLETLPSYERLVQAASQNGVAILLRSGFRTFAEQEHLFNGFQLGLPGFNKAAPPGFSNHQHGQAFDLDVGGFDGDPVYDWLKKNGPGLGFIRTVSGEPWHWELRPQQAAQLAQQRQFKTADTNP